MKKVIFWDMAPCDSYRNYVSDESVASIIRVKRISELGKTLAVTSSNSLSTGHKDWTLRNNELLGIWKEAVATLLKVLFYNSPDRLEGTTTKARYAPGWSL
jgi:hypothetical protein